MKTSIISFRKNLLSVSLSVSLLSTVAAFAVPAHSASAASSSSAAAEAVNPLVREYEAFLSEKLLLTLPQSYTKGEFLNDLAKALRLPSVNDVVFKDLPASSPYYASAAAAYKQGIVTSDSIQASQPLSAITAVQIAIKASNLKELAYSYPERKANKTLAKLHLSVNSLGLQGAQEIAAAIDTGLLPEPFFNLLKDKKPVSKSLAAVLLGKTLTFKGQYKHFIGTVNDPAIYAELLDAYQTSGIVKAPDLQKVGDEALKKNLVTGYTIRDSRFESNFIDSLTITYGHSDIQHAVQLIGLLRSEGINAKVQYEPRTSAFIYLKEWGDPGQSETYEVIQIENGNYIEYAKEYELIFEFENAQDKARFEPIILKYAKKNEEKQSGLIYKSWWQPLYYSQTFLPDYKLITNNKLSDGRYYVESFSLNEKSANVVAGFKQIDPTADVTSYQFWADAPFFRYLNGESK